MSPALEAPTTGAWDALFWINDVERAHSEFKRIRSVAYVFRRLFTLACERRTNRIEGSASALAREIGSSEESIAMATGFLRAHGLDAEARRGLVIWTFTPEWCPQPFHDDRKTLTLWPVEKIPGAQESPPENPTTRAVRRPQFPGPQEFSPGPQEFNGEETGKFLVPRSEFLAPRNSDFNSLLKRAPTLQKNQYVTSLVVLKNNPGSWGPGMRVEVDSNKLEEPHSLRSAVPTSAFQDLPKISGSHLGRGVIDRIVAARTVDNPEHAALLAQCLFHHMRKFGPPDRDNREPQDLLKDDTLLAGILAIAPLGDPDAPPQKGTLLNAFRDLDMEYKPCGKKYAWFRSTLANRIHGTDPDELSTALDKARPRRRKPKPSWEGGEAPQTQTPNPEYADNLIHQVSSAAAGRKLR